MPKPIIQNTLFYGDNLPILRETDMPPYSSGQTFKQAEKVKKSTGKQENLL
jgi:hypothetical protein